MGRSKREPYVRLTRPLVRDAGVLRPAGWDEALDRAAEGFRRNIAAGGPSAFGLFSRTGHAPSVAGLVKVFGGWNPTQMLAAMERGDMTAVYVIGENPVQSDCARTITLMSNLDHLVVQDVFLTKTAQLAHVVLPASTAWDDIELVRELARRLGHSVALS